jgi:hypothetical protein
MYAGGEQIDEEGTLYVDDFDVHEGEVRGLVQDMQNCSTIHPDDIDAYVHTLTALWRGFRGRGM